VDRAGELDLALDALDAVVADRGAGAHPHGPAEGVVAEIDDREAVDAPDAAAVGLDHERAALDHLLQPLLEEIGAVVALPDRDPDVVAVHNLVSEPCGPEARLGDDVADLRQPCGQLLLVVAEPRA